MCHIFFHFFCGLNNLSGTIIWLVLNPHLVATLCSSFSRENDHPLIICSSLSLVDGLKNLSGTITLPPNEASNLAPENGWLEYDCFLLGPGLFSGALAVSFREGI